VPAPPAPQNGEASIVPPARPLRGAVLRFAALVAIVAGGLALLRWGPVAERLDPAELLATFRAIGAEPWAPVALIAAYVVLCPLGIPVSPLIMAGGVVFGFATGTLLNLAGTWLGAAATFGAARLLGRDLVAQVLGARLARVERAVERHGFWTLVRLRFVPIPFALVNYAAALAGVRSGTFLGATALGLAPAVALFTYFAAALSRAAAGEPHDVLAQLGAAFAALLVLTFVVPWLLRRRGAA
jgi:phospholipase D1/2